MLSSPDDLHPTSTVGELARVVIERGPRTEPEVEQLANHFADAGLEVRWASQQQLARRHVIVDRSTLAVGGLPFMSTALRQLGLALPPPDDYPDALAAHFHRRIWASTVGQLRDELTRGHVVFAKPRIVRKRFTGKVFSRDDEWPLPTMRGGLAVWCAEPVAWRSEFRIFVADGDVVGVRCYAGDPSREPDPSVVSECVTALSRTLAGFAVDVGVLDSGVTAVVEVNEGFALGTYGLPAAAIARVLTARWIQLLRVNERRVSGGDEVDTADLVGRRVAAVIIGWHVFEGERSSQQLFVRLDDGSEMEAHTHGSGGLVLLRRPVPDDFSMDEFGSFEFHDVEADHPAAVLLGRTIDTVERIMYWDDTVIGLRLTTAAGNVVLLNDYDELYISDGELPPGYADARIERTIRGTDT